MKMLLVLFLFINSIALFAQKNITTDCNTIFICVDSSSYEKIFKNSFIKDTLFVCRENTSATNQETYTGKYAIGQSATLEFFKPTNSPNIGDQLGDWGIEFKTRKLGELTQLQSIINKNKVKVDTVTTTITEDSVAIAWYKSIGIKEDRHQLSIIEYQKEYLQLLGFSEEEMSQPMTYEQFNSKLSNGRNYPRQFKKIKSISVVIDKKQLKTLQDFCTLNRLSHKNHTFSNEEFSINYELVSVPSKFPVRKIEIALLSKQKSRNIKLSEALVLKVNADTASLIFNQ